MKTVHHWIEELSNKKWRKRAKACRKLAKLSDERAIDALIERLEDEKYKVRLKASKALGEIGNSRALEPLVEHIGDEDSDVRAAICEALGNIGDTQAVVPLIEKLEDECFYVRCAACCALEKIGDVRAFNPLSKKLNDNDSFVRGDAQRALITLMKSGLPKEPKITSTLIGLLDDATEEDVCLEAIRTLVQMEEPRAIPPLTKLVKKTEFYDVREEAEKAVEALKALGFPEDAKAIAILTTDNTGRTAEEWYDYGLGEFDAGNAEAAVVCFDKALEIDATDASIWCTKGIAKAALGQRDKASECFDKALTINQEHPMALLGKGRILDETNRHTEATQYYDRVLETNPEDARVWYAKGVNMFYRGLYGGENTFGSIECLDKALQIKPRLLRAWDYKGMALADIGRYEEAIECYETALTIDSEDALAQLGIMKAEEAMQRAGTTTKLDKLLKNLSSRRWKKRARAAQKIGESGDRRALAKLTELTKDDNREVRAAACRALGFIGNGKIIETLIDCLDDPDDYFDEVQIAVCEALGTIGSFRCTEKLLERLSDEGTTYYDVEETVCIALGKIGDPRAVNKLIDRLENSGGELKIAACRALAQIGDPRAIEPLVETAKIGADSEGRLVSIRERDAVNSLINAGRIAQRAVQEITKNPKLTEQDVWDMRVYEKEMKRDKHLPPESKKAQTTIPDEEGRKVEDNTTTSSFTEESEYSDELKSSQGQEKERMDDALPQTSDYNDWVDVAEDAWFYGLLIGAGIGLALGLIFGMQKVDGTLAKILTVLSISLISGIFGGIFRLGVIAGRISGGTIALDVFVNKSVNSYILVWMTRWFYRLILYPLVGIPYGVYIIAKKQINVGVKGFFALAGAGGGLLLLIIYILSLFA